MNHTESCGTVSDFVEIVEVALESIEFSGYLELVGVEIDVWVVCEADATTGTDSLSFSGGD